MHQAAAELEDEADVYDEVDQKEFESRESG
jgi:hypothetical protein